MLAKVVVGLAVGVLEVICSEGFVAVLKQDCTVVLHVVDVDCCVDLGGGLLRTL